MNRLLQSILTVSSPNTSIAMAASLRCISVSVSGLEMGGGGEGGAEEIHTDSIGYVVS